MKGDFTQSEYNPFDSPVPAKSRVIDSFTCIACL